MMNSTFPSLDATAIHSWADRREAHHQLPELVRRLLLASGHITGISMPAGASIALPGVDGWVRSSQSTPWIPAGDSVWELSCNGNPGQKADSDYRKRTAEFPAEERQRITYVQLTARKWNRKNEWAEARKREDKWADVRALDAHDLEAWLKQHAPVALLLAEWLGMAGFGILSPEVHFRHWASMSEPAISIDALLAGRDIAVNTLASLLRTQKGHVPLLADSSEEAVAVACAVVSSCSDLACRSVVVSAPEGWQFVHGNPGIDIVLITSADLSGYGAGFQGTLVFPAQPDHLIGKQQDEGSLVRFERPLRHEFTEALNDLGIARDEADRQAVHSGRSWSAWRRLHPSAPGLLSGRDEVEKLLDGRLAATLCLIDRWNHAREDDWAFVCKTGDLDREAAEQAMRRLARMDDPPVVLAGGIWKVKAPREFFQLHAFRITSPLLDRFLSEAERLLGMPDPLLQYPPEEREIIRLTQDLEQEGSGLLREAIADGLARLGALTTENDLLPDLNPEDRVARLIDSLLHDAELERWISISGLLPALAEAAPESFLAAVESGASDENSPVARLISTYEEGLLSGRIYRTGLLWALERLAWNPELLPRAALLLARLSLLPLRERDNWANTPLNSLINIFRFWSPQTYASVNERKEILELLACEVPDAAFSLLQELLRFGFDAATPGNRPLWRPWGTECDMGPSSAEQRDSLHHAAGLLLELAEQNAARLEPLVRNIGHLHVLDANLASKVLERLDAVARKGNDRNRILLRDTLRHVLWRPRKLPEELKRECREAWEKLAPRDVVVRHAWLFGSSPRLPEAMDDWKKEDERLQRWRNEAVRDIFRETGWNGIARLIREVEEPRHLGMAVADCYLPEIASYVLRLQPEYRKGPEYPFLAGYLHGLDRSGCKDFLRRLLEKAEDESWTAERVAIFLTAAPFCRETWEIVEQASPEVRELFWKRCHPRLSFSENNARWEEDNLVAERLLDAGRPWSLLQAPGFGADRFSEDILLKLLERIVAGDELEALKTGDTVMSRYDLREVVDFLEASVSVDRQQLVRIEYGLLPLFVDDLDGGPERLRSLMKTIMSDPALFVDLLCKIYNSECENVEEQDDSIPEEMISVMWRLFHSGIRTQPGGACKDEEIDQAAFRDFIERTLDLASSRCRRKMAEHNLGQIIARGPRGDDGLVPHEAAREILDRPELEEMRKGLYFGLINSRGVTTRAPYEGGRQERDLAARYRENANAMRTQYPRLAAILDQVAKHYERDAKRHDAGAARTRELH